MQLTRDDRSLVRDYIGAGSTAAFAELVRRHRDFVYSICLRELGNTQWAEDATQVVFVVLSRRAGMIRRDVSVRTWLFSVARLTARDVRQREMRHAAALNGMEITAAATASTTFDIVGVELDSALERLRPADRELVLKRYVDGVSFAEAGQVIGISEEAARKRVVRSLQRLRRSLSHLNPVAAEAAVITALGVFVSHSAPSHLAQKLAACESAEQYGLISSTVSASVFGVAKGIIDAMRMAQMKFAAAAAAATLVGSASTVVIMQANSVPGHSGAVQPYRVSSISAPTQDDAGSARRGLSERLENIQDVLAPEINPLASPRARSKQIRTILKKDMVVREEPKGFAITITASLKKPLTPPALPGELQQSAGPAGAVGAAGQQGVYPGATPGVYPGPSTPPQAAPRSTNSTQGQVVR